MINIICTVHRPFPVRSTSQRTRRSLNTTLRWITGITLFLFQFRIQILTHSWVKLLCYRVLIWAQHPWCRGEGLPQSGSLQRCHHCRHQLDTSHHRLQVHTGRHRLQPAIQARVPALLPHFPARDTGHHRRGHLQLEGKPHRGECLCGWHNAIATVTFFFATDGKSFMPTFNCSVHNTSLLIHLCLQSSFFISRTWLHRWGSKHGTIRRGRGWWYR
jgi:hypothetical protein